jgi:hypothetical protein
MCVRDDPWMYRCRVTRLRVGIPVAALVALMYAGALRRVPRSGSHHRTCVLLRQPLELSLGVGRVEAPKRARPARCRFEQPAEAQAAQRTRAISLGIEDVRRACAAELGYRPALSSRRRRRQTGMLVPVL